MGAEMTKDEALKLALEVLEDLQGGCTDSDDGTIEAITVCCPEVINDIKEALAQPEQEPHCYMDEYGYVEGEMKPYMEENGGWYPVYTTPPQRKPLTDEQIGAILENPSIAEKHQGNWLVLPYAYARAIEAAHGIKGE